MNITFDNNTAYLAPNIYISNFDLCSWQHINDSQVYFSAENVLKWPVFDYVMKYAYYTIVYMFVYVHMLNKKPGCKNVRG